MNSSSGTPSKFPTRPDTSGDAPAAGATAPLARAAVLALAYFLLALAVQWLTVSSQVAMALWPAAGLALVALAVWGWRYWPGLWLGAFAAKLLHSTALIGAELTFTALLLAALIASGIALQAVLGALLVRRFLQHAAPLVKERDALAFLFLGGPLACLVSASVAVPGLYFLGDLPASALVANWLTWWVGDSLGVLLFAPLVLLLLPESRRHWRGHAGWIAGPLLMAGLLTVAGYAWLLQSETKTHRETLVTQASDLHNRLENVLNQRRARLRAVEGLFEASEEVTRAEFAAFNRLAAAYEGVEVIQWAPRVTQAERAAFEAAARREGLSSYSLLEFDTSGALVVAAERANYYPVQFATSADAATPLGFDLGANPQQRAAMMRSAGNTRPALVACQTFLEQEPAANNWCLLVPIYRPGFNAQGVDEAARRDALRGFTIAVLDPHKMWAQEIEHAAREGLVFRITGSADWHPKRPMLAGLVPAGREARADWSVRMEGFAGTGLRLDLWSLAPWSPTQSPTVPRYYAGALLLALLSGVLALGNVGHKRRLARESTRRAASEQRLVTLLENVPVGVMVHDRQAIILSVNTATQGLLQVPAARLLGKSTRDPQWHFLREDGSRMPVDEYPGIQVLTKLEPVQNRVVGVVLPGGRGMAWMLVSAAPIFDAQHHLSEVAVTFMDITARRRLEQRERNRTRVMEAISSAASLKAILELIANAVEAEAPQARCSILLLDDDGKHLRLGAAPSLPDYYNQAVDGLAIGADASACGTAAYTGQRVIAADLQGDPRWAPLCELARQADLGSCWSEPIIGANGVVLGTFATYHRQPGEPSADDLELISLAAELARLAIERKRTEADILHLNSDLERRVTERTAALKQANASLHDSRARIAAILDTVDDGIITIDAHGTVETFNPAAERLFGYTAAEVIGHNINRLMPEPYHSAHDGYLARYRATGEARLIGNGREVEGRRKDGSTFPLELAVSEMRLGPTRHSLGFTGVVRDITERRAGERAARYLQEAVQAIPEGFAIFDPDDRLVLCNSTYLALYHLGDAQENVGKSFEELLRVGLARGDYPAAIGQEEDWLAARLALHRNPGPAFEQAMLDGRWLRISECRLSDGSIAGLRSDITELRRARESAQTAQQAAEAANRAKSDFLATMSHEIRTPMNGVIGMVDVLHQTSLKGYQVEMVDTIRDSAFALLGIIEDILDFSKIEAGKLELERVPTSVAEVVEKACGLLEHLAVSRAVDLTLFTDPAIPALVLGDAQRLRQIVINLVNNAIKFSSGQDRTGRVSVRAVLAGQRPDRIVVDIRITDNGIGMDQATQARLFNAFTQAEASTTRRFGGTGLGLAIARNLANLMGGEIAVQSTPGAGSTFTLRLPCAPLANRQEPSVKPVAGLACLVVGATGTDSLADDWAAYLAHGDAKVERAQDLVAARDRLAALASGPWVIVLDVDATALLPAALSPSPSPASGEQYLFDELRAARPDLEVLLVVVGRGKRRRARCLDAEHRLWAIDANALTRQGLLKAVAIAAGRLPEDEESTAVGKSAAALVAPTRAEALQQRRLILVAEDNETNQKVIVQQLALLGFAADVAADGVEALERWRSGDYALLLTDLHMPRMDGYQLASAIRAAEQEQPSGARRIPVIALTANALRGEALRCLEIGMDDYLSKPTPLVDLKATLEKWLPAAPANGAAFLPSPQPSPAGGRGSDSPQAHSEPAPLLPPPAGEPTPLLPPLPPAGEGWGEGAVLPPLPPAGEGWGEGDPALDVRVLAALVGDDPATLREFLLVFAASATTIAAELAAACAAGDAAQAGAQAHKLKSAARSVGALALGELCAEIEQAGKSGNSAALGALMRQFEHELAAVQACLDAWVQEHNNVCGNPT